MLLASRHPIFSLQQRILELLYKDLIGAFNTEFIRLCPSAESSLDTLEEHLVEAKHTIGSIGLLEFYLSSFLHHLRVDNSNSVLELVRGPLSLIRYTNSRSFGSLRLENYEYR
jgi:hypothetical protein